MADTESRNNARLHHGPLGFKALDPMADTERALCGGRVRRVGARFNALDPMADTERARVLGGKD